MITLDHITKTYGKDESAFNALNDISFSIEEGSTLAIIGKSGSGKSTLMHIMSGLDRPTRGKVVVSNIDVYKLKSRDIDNFRSEQISFIFQSFFVEANQTCYQNVMLPLEIAKVPMAKRKKLVMDALTAVELDNKVNKLASTLSGGQKQRLAIARAIVNKPKILFADEPTGNLDTSTGDKIIKLIFDLNKSLGTTIVLVTHDHDLARRCQTQIHLKDGRIDRTVGSKSVKPVKSGKAK